MVRIQTSIIMTNALHIIYFLIVYLLIVNCYFVTVIKIKYHSDALVLLKFITIYIIINIISVFVFKRIYHVSINFKNYFLYFFIRKKIDKYKRKETHLVSLFIDFIYHFAFCNKTLFIVYIMCKQNYVYTLCIT